jgi:trans-aconitate 2-methyltransferase
VSARAGVREWNAEAYDRVSDAQFQWGVKVLDRLPLGGGEAVLDAGCGSGRVTEVLLERVPHGRVVAVDASEGMVEKARERLGGRAEVFQADLGELMLDPPVEAIFSNAVFHWLPDHDRLFARLHDALRPGGALTAQCGGEGNVASLREAIRTVSEQEPFAAHLDGFEGVWNFAGPEETAGRLERAGFTEVDCRLEPKPFRPEDPVEFLRTCSLGPHLGRLPEGLRPLFVEAVVERMDKPVELDYVRLEIDARRGP